MKTVCYILSVLSLSISLFASTLVWDAPDPGTNNVAVSGYRVYCITGSTAAEFSTNAAVATTTSTSWPISSSVVPAGASATFWVTAFANYTSTNGTTIEAEGDPSDPLFWISPALPSVPVIISNQWQRKARNPWQFYINWISQQPGAEYVLVFERYDVTPHVFYSQTVVAQEITGTLPLGLYKFSVTGTNAAGAGPSAFAYSPGYPGAPKGVSVP